MSEPLSTMLAIMATERGRVGDHELAGKLNARAQEEQKREWFHDGIPLPAGYRTDDTDIVETLIHTIGSSRRELQQNCRNTEEMRALLRERLSTWRA